MLIAAKNMHHVFALKVLLSQEFDVKNLGAATKILGEEIHRDRGSRNCGYLNEAMLRKCKTGVIASAVGCLVYAMVCDRPDLAHAVSQICKYMSKSGRHHCEVVKWIFRYLKGIVGYGVVFGSQQNDPLVVGYLDSNYAEYMAVAEIAKEALWLNGLAKELGVEQGGVQLHCDSKNAIYLAENQKVHTSENAADMLTKPLIVDKFNHCLDLLNVYSC
ncbi:UNVERIFIED_CONTAM: Retrovirus-related Pol polyprotein from transposon TNT 1-94 [Sesamum angustifolium]|uniref:Retrovirus-related Pol polyprotein from transposon TNT 1-94 n=1 Tax=Sesamum angustifolium TaxID=2727405 RepID=A0AAW2RNZ7_9LAMI